MELSLINKPDTKKVTSDYIYREPKWKEEQEAFLISAWPAHLTELEKLLTLANDKWTYEDRIYRFYHQSYKVYDLQIVTTNIVEIRQSLLPGLSFNKWFLEIVAQGTGIVFDDNHNKHWPKCTRPILEAFSTPSFSWRWPANTASISARHPRPCPVVGQPSFTFSTCAKSLEFMHP